MVSVLLYSPSESLVLQRVVGGVTEVFANAGGHALPSQADRADGDCGANIAFPTPKPQPT